MIEVKIGRENVDTNSKINYLTDDVRVRPTFSAVKFWAPNFFLETHSDYVKKLGSGEKPHLLAPQGTQGGYLGLK